MGILPDKAWTDAIIFTPVDGKVSGLKGKDAEFVTNVLSDFKEFNLGGRDEYNKRERYVHGMNQDPSTKTWKWYDEKEEIEDEFLRSKEWNQVDSSLKILGVFQTMQKSLIGF